MTAAVGSSSARYPDRVAGQHLGLEFPTNVEPLLAQGADFLTAAFHASGALAPNNRVTAITDSKEFFGGGAGRKLLLSVTYDNPMPGLHEHLFVKYPRDFGDPLRDLFSHLMEPEARFALLSRQADFPITVPKCYFADYDPVSRSGILISERIAFGRDGIEPFYDKCLDYEVPDLFAHYQALIKVIARLAGAHKAGRFGAEVDRHFPHTIGRIREDDRIPYAPDQLAEKLETLARFAAQNPGLIPRKLASPEFLKRFSREAQDFLEHEMPIKRYLNQDADFVALCHWNANIDNAWFWRGAGGELEAGLLDWGSVSQMNVAQSIFGALCAVETGFWNDHKNKLVTVFADEYQRSGGPQLDASELGFQVQLFVAMLGLAWLIDAPTIIAAQISDLGTVNDRFDPKLKTNFLARAQLQLLVVLLNAWQSENYGAVLERFLARAKA